MRCEYFGKRLVNDTNPGPCWCFSPSIRWCSASNVFILSPKVSSDCLAVVHLTNGPWREKTKHTCMKLKGNCHRGATCVYTHQKKKRTHLSAVCVVWLALCQPCLWSSPWTRALFDSVCVPSCVNVCLWALHYPMCRPLEWLCCQGLGVIVIYLFVKSVAGFF